MTLSRHCEPEGRGNPDIDAGLPRCARNDEVVRIGIVAGEASGDLLAANLIKSLRKQYPHAEFFGVTGPKMIAAGCQSLAAMDILSVLGVVDVLKRLPRLLAFRRRVFNQFLKHKIDIFIGVDAPDFNLTLEGKLRRKGVMTVHYHSPSVWAWRSGRVKKIARTTDLMLTLFPFETQIYQDNGIPVAFVGHPMADEIAIPQETGHSDKPVVALMPGSRSTELNYLAPVFLETAIWLQKQLDVEFIVPMVNAKRRVQFEAIKNQVAPDLVTTIVEDDVRAVLQKANAALVASGTATLEAMLMKVPMVIAAKLSPFNFFLAKRLIKTPFVGLPNLIAGEALVPEFIQDAAVPEVLGQAILDYLRDSEKAECLRGRFAQLHGELQCGAGDAAAVAIVGMVRNRGARFAESI